MKLKVLDLFSGIGGFSLGLERAGMQTVAFCEIEEYPRRVLTKHWPNVPIYRDVRELTGEQIKKEIGTIDVICGGFPCQDISSAGKGAGINGSKSGLWKEFARLIGELGPKWVIIENVAALRSKGLVTVLQDLAKIGHDAEWHCIPACAVGAEHQRDRIWIIAHPRASRLQEWVYAGENKESVGGCGPRLRLAFGSENAISTDYWDNQPTLGRGVHGIPNRVDRIKCLGNSVIPIIPELIGRAIIDVENRQITA